MYFWISSKYLSPLFVHIEIAFPFAPALPLLPILWTYASFSTGSSKLTTWVIFSISIPLAAISVATSLLNSPYLNLSITSSLSFCNSPPWIFPTEYDLDFKYSNTLSTLSLVLPKITAVSGFSQINISFKKFSLSS